MDTVNNLANQTAATLRRQQSLIELNSQAIQQIQREIKEIGHEIDTLWNVAGQLCDQRWILRHVCVTPARANITAQTKQVSDWLKQTYLPNFKNISDEVHQAIDAIESVKLTPITFDLSVLKDAWDYVTSWFSWPNLTTWAIIAVLVLVGLVVIKCLFDRLLQTQQQVRLTALAAMQMTEPGLTGGQVAAYLLRIAEHQI